MNRTTQLSTREKEVLQLLAEGKTNNEIAKELNMSYSTAKTHIEHLYSKTGINDRVRLALWGVLSGVVKTSIKIEK